MRTQYLFANLKNRLSAAQSLDLALEVRNKVGAGEGRFVGICPSDAALAWTAGCKGNLLLAAQNCGWTAPYSLTGELSAADLALFGITHCLVGHSERRLYLNESDEIVGRRLASLLTGGLIPILCIGEGLDDRRRGGTAEVLDQQLQVLGKAFAQSGRDPSPDAVIVAYEPMWAISTSGSHLHLEPAAAAEAHDLVRRQLDAQFGPGFGEAVSVLFGGSINEINAQAYFAHPTIDGGLVGSGMQTIEGFCGVVGAFQNR